MGFFLSVLYFVTSYVTPAVLFGPLAAYRIELILAVLLLLVSVPSIAGSLIGKTPQTLALIGLAFACLMSVLVGAHWAGGAAQAFLEFVPSPFAYFMVCLHCNSKKRLQILILMMLLVCLFVIAQGSGELQHANPHLATAEQGDENPYLFSQWRDDGETIYRIRGLGEINDPNDLAQLIVCVIPLVFIFWRPRRMILNILFVLLPVSALFVGAYLTHSRGAMLALLAMAVVAARRRIGTMPALLLAVVLFVAAMTLNFTGGRDISADAGADRTDLWGQSMELFSHPLFGVGFGGLTDYLGHTAHNSVLVCAAELGLFGLYFWTLFLFPTVRDVLTLASHSDVTQGQEIVTEKAPFSPTMRKVEFIDKTEINRLGRLLTLSLTGFLVAAWFLSRAFVMTFFLLGGLIEVVFEMALRQEMISPRLPTARVLRYSGMLAIGLILVMYVVLRTANLMR